MPWIAGTVVIGAVILFALMRGGRTKGLDSLGVVSERWIADERGRRGE